jgi:hypothetical protein
VTEIAWFFFAGDPPTDVINHLADFRHAVVGADGVRGATVRVTYEEVEHGDVKGKAVVLVIGREGVEAHEAFQRSEVFGEKIALVAKEVKGDEMAHVRFVEL